MLQQKLISNWISMSRQLHRSPHDDRALASASAYFKTHVNPFSSQILQNLPTYMKKNYIIHKLKPHIFKEFVPSILSLLKKKRKKKHVNCNVYG